MKKVLVVSGHTDLKSSVANSTILGILKEKLPGAEFDLLDSCRLPTDPASRAMFSGHSET